jgi:flagellar biosynthesis/type III secretory pathway ATPase
MTSESRRLWLVERSYRDENLVTLVYATTDGEYFHKRQLSVSMLMQKSVTAAKSFDREDLVAVEEPDRRERYAAEAKRMADQYDPDEAV